MGRFDSSLTRVQPVFSALYEMDRSGESWLHQFLEMAARKTGSEPAEIPSTLGHLLVPPCFELLVDPPKPYLRWLIEHPKDLVWPGEKAWSKWVQETQEKRRALREEDPAVQAEALYELETCRCLPRGAWWRFEGITHVDCALLTPSTVIFVEGKRTEMGPSKSVTWYPHRNQVLRVLDCAAAFAQRTGRPHFFAVLVVEKGLVESDPDRQAAAEAVISPRTVQQSLPHLMDEERAELLSHYLGTTTWQDIVETFELGSGVLIDRVDC
jgi:hypothetical protein